MSFRGRLSLFEASAKRVFENKKQAILPSPPTKRVCREASFGIPLSVEILSDTGQLKIAPEESKDVQKAFQEAYKELVVGKNQQRRQALAVMAALSAYRRSLRTKKLDQDRGLCLKTTPYWVSVLSKNLSKWRKNGWKQKKDGKPPADCDVLKKIYILRTGTDFKVMLKDQK